MSVAIRIMRNEGVEVPTYVDGDNKDLFLAVVNRSEGIVYLYKPVLEIKNDRKRQKLIDAIVTKAKRKYGIKEVIERPDSTPQINDGMLYVYTPQPDTLKVPVDA